MLLDRQVVCSDCHQALSESEHVQPERRTPCATCGSTGRAVQVVTAGVIRSVDDLALPFDSDTALRECSDADERLVIVERYIDRDRNIYRERVEDEASGQVLWQVESALDRHLRAL